MAASLITSGLLVHGANHLIVAGPEPSLEQARRLVKAWELPEIGVPADTGPWQIKTREFRENLQWAVVLENGEPHSAAVSVLLDELRARGVPMSHGNGPLLHK